MNEISKDILVTVLEMLNLKSIMAAELTNKQFNRCARNERVWKKLCLDEFGTIEKEDVDFDLEDAGTSRKIPHWKEVFEMFYEALKDGRSGGCCFDVFEHRKYNHGACGFACFDAFVFRRHDKSMCIPLLRLSVMSPSFGKKGMKGIKPRRGDTILDMLQIGYRNNGVNFWDGEKIVECDDLFDDYGHPPLQFRFPEFPVFYFYCGRSKLTIYDVDNAVIEMIKRGALYTEDDLEVGDVFVYDHLINGGWRYIEEI